MARSSRDAPTPLELLARLLDRDPGLRFSPTEAAVMALAHVGRTSASSSELSHALCAVGFTGLASSRALLASCVTPGWTRLKGDKLCVVDGETPDKLVARIIARIRNPPPPKPVAPPKSKPPPKPKPVGAKEAAAKAAAAPRPADPTPAVAPLAPPPVTWEPFDLADAARILAGVQSPPTALVHALEAHALASADHFEELLSTGSLRGVEAHTYQTETVRRVLRHFRGRALLADEVGLGKTIEAIMVLREYQLRGMVRRVLVLVPPSLVGQWESELVEKAGLQPLVAGDVDAKGDFWRKDGLILASQALARLPRHAAVLAEQAWDLVIVDEAHRLKSRTTLAWKLVDALKSRFLLMLTATPVETDLEELYNLVTLLRPGQLATLADFRRRFVDPKDPTMARDTQRLRGLLAEVMVRNTRANSGLMLPPRFVTTVTTEPTEPESRLYQAVVTMLQRSRTREAADAPGGRRMADTLMFQAGSSPAAVRESVKRHRAGSHSAAVEADLAEIDGCVAAVTTSSKGSALLDIFRAHDEKILVFTRFRETLAYVQELAHAAGIPTVVVHGGLDRAHKDEAFRRFRQDVPLLLCSDVGSEGHNLQFCHVLVNFDLPWNPMVIEQRIGRLHRYGQTEPVRVYNLCAKGTAEERLLDVLDRRVHLFELVVGEMDMVLGNVVEQQDLEDRVLSIYAASRDEGQIAAGFDAIAEELARARGQYEQVKALDHALFGKEFEA